MFWKYSLGGKTFFESFVVCKLDQADKLPFFYEFPGNREQQVKQLAV